MSRANTGNRDYRFVALKRSWMLLLLLLNLISKSNSSEIDFTASKMIKPATPTITTAKRMVLGPIKKIEREEIKAETALKLWFVKLSN